MWVVLLAAAGTFALTMGLFLADVNTNTGLGIANISPAFADGQLWRDSRLGGKVPTLTGSYDTIWIIDIVLAIGAALIHMPIKEAPLALKMQAA